MKNNITIEQVKSKPITPVKNWDIRSKKRKKLKIHNEMNLTKAILRTIQEFAEKFDTFEDFKEALAEIIGDNRDDKI